MEKKKSHKQFQVEYYCPNSSHLKKREHFIEQIHISFTDHCKFNHPEQKYVLIKLNNQTALEEGITAKAEISFFSLSKTRLWRINKTVRQTVTWVTVGVNTTFIQ